MFLSLNPLEFYLFHQVQCIHYSYTQKNHYVHFGCNVMQIGYFPYKLVLFQLLFLFLYFRSIEHYKLYFPGSQVMLTYAGFVPWRHLQENIREEERKIRLFLTLFYCIYSRAPDPARGDFHGLASTRRLISLCPG